MKYERSFLKISGHDRNQNIKVPSLRVGDWHVHYANFQNEQKRGDGLVVAHKSGIAGPDGITPVQAVRVLRAYQRLPPCPVSDAEFSERMRTHTIRECGALYDWVRQARRLADQAVWG